MANTRRSAKSVIIKLTDKNKPEEAKVARGELIGAGYLIVYECEAELVGVDATKDGNGQQRYGPTIVLIGEM
jgi:hypothetical protein